MKTLEQFLCISCNWLSVNIGQQWQKWRSHPAFTACHSAIYTSLSPFAILDLSKQYWHVCLDLAFFHTLEFQLEFHCVVSDVWQSDPVGHVAIYRFPSCAVFSTKLCVSFDLFHVRQDFLKNLAASRMASTGYRLLSLWLSAPCSLASWPVCPNYLRSCRTSRHDVYKAETTSAAETQSILQSSRTDCIASCKCSVYCVCFPDGKDLASKSVTSIADQPRGESPRWRIRSGWMTSHQLPITLSNLFRDRSIKDSSWSLPLCHRNAYKSDWWQTCIRELSKTAAWNHQGTKSCTQKENIANWIRHCSWSTSRKFWDFH